MFYMMCGLPASGKSYYAKQLKQKTGAVIHSSDKIRDELFSDVNEQDNNQEVFTVLHRRLKTDLKAGKSVIYDATNISSKRRRSFLKELKNITCNKTCVLMATPYDQCLVNNKNRGRQIPEHVIKRMYMSWNTPYWYEGWDDIQIIYYPDSRASLPLPICFMEKLGDYNQENKHHTLTLGKHLERTWKYVCQQDGVYSVRTASLLHDCGKPFTKTFINHKGLETVNAHYYRHENVGAYDSLFFRVLKPIEDVAILVQLHMMPYNWERNVKNGERTKEKYKKRWGKELFNNVMLLHEADKLAH